jgi:hypothetical protein
MHKKSVELFEALRKQITAHTERIVRQLAAAAASPTSSAPSTTTTTPTATASASTSALAPIATASASASAGASASGSSGDVHSFLSAVDSVWNESCEQLLTVRGIFLYLDRTYVIHQSEVRSIWDMGLSLFRDYLKAPGTMMPRPSLVLCACSDRCCVA